MMMLLALVAAKTMVALPPLVIVMIHDRDTAQADV
jgi:hypothetical protein